MRRRRWSTRRPPYTAMGPTRAIGMSTATATATGTRGPTERQRMLDGTPAAPSPPVEAQQVCRESSPAHEAALTPCRGQLRRRDLSTLRQEDVRLAGLARGLLARRAQHRRVGAARPLLRVFGHVAA